MRRSLPVVLALAGCAADPVVYTGEPQRFVLDSITLPRTNAQARELGMDLDGKTPIDNQLGQVTGVLGSANALTDHGHDMIAVGLIAASIEIVADDLVTDPSVSVQWFGSERDDTEPVTGRFVDGRFETTGTGQFAVRLPIFFDADPSAALLRSARLELVPDGRGGYDARIGGGFVHQTVMDVAFAGIEQMFATRPREHMLLFTMLDQKPRDLMITRHEWDTNTFFTSLLEDDVVLDGRSLLSVGFAAHFSPCAEGNCARGAPTDHCFDRVLDGDETDVDCGGACAGCAVGFTCTEASDCDSNACTDGTCAPPSCSNGIQDGLESDVDCGGPCGPCALGGSCWTYHDCESGQCGDYCNAEGCYAGAGSVCRTPT